MFTSLYSFCSKQPNCADGASPAAGLVEGTNGMFYGTTTGGGLCSGCGTLFRISSTGGFTTLYNFCTLPLCADGSSPKTSLIQAVDGQLYGTTSSGTVFKIAPSGGALTVLHTFAASEGAQLQNLMQATDGNFYGTAQTGGASNLGTLFKMDSTGAVTVLVNFCGDQTCQRSFNPTGVMQATNGLPYGTTLGIGNGAVFTFGFPPFVRLSPSGGSVGTEVNIYGTDLSGATSVSFHGTPATFTVISAGEITTTVPAGASFGSVTVTTPTATLVSDVVFRFTP